MSSPRASVVVRCYNEADHIGKLFHGLSEQSMQDYEIVLVDSGSTDGTVEIAEDFGVEETVYIDPTNFSFGRALNYGCDAASGELCVIASAHVYPKRDDWLERLLEKFNENVALVYGKQRGNEVTAFSENQIFKQWFPEHDIERQDHPFCNNANAAIRRDVWKEYPYDEQLTGLEDVDWAKRVQKDGYDISYASEAEIIHVHDETAREVFNRYRREAYAHKQIMPNRSFSLLDFFRLSARNIISDYRAAFRTGDLSTNVTEIPKFRLLQFWGTYRGFAREGPISDRLWQRFYYPDRNTFPDPNRPEDERRTDDLVRTGESNRIDYSDRPMYAHQTGEDTESDAV
jgi:glycosyltransferase involved in cell wall biosynthesis